MSRVSGVREAVREVEAGEGGRAGDRHGRDHAFARHGGKTYSQVSAEWIAGGMKNATLATERTTLFTGETLNGLLLNAWGWSVIGMIATLAGWILILLGAALFLLPLANWQINLRGRRPADASV